VRQDTEEKEKANSKTEFERLMAAEGIKDPTAGACLSFALRYYVSSYSNLSLFGH
jgi:hypothetical protein